MERTKYFNYTRPGETQLNHTEDSRARAILKRQRSSSQMGARTGFRISINVADETKIDIGPGEGYTGGFFEQKNLRATNAGEVISSLTAITKVGQALANYFTGTKNYISLLYAEAESNTVTENHYPNVGHKTVVTETYTVEALSETDWLALSDDELEQRVLVGIVTARGAGIDLSIADVDQLIQPNNHPYAGTLVTLSAVVIDQISDETIIGIGVLRWEFASQKLYWTAPGDAEGLGTLIIANGTYYVMSDTVSYFIKVVVTAAALPGGNTTENVTVKSLYGRAIPMYSAVDQAHRDMLGTGKKSLINPHALDINDISGGPFEHASFYHSNGISNHANRTQLECNIDVANDRIEITNLGSQFDSFLIDGQTFQVISGVPALTDAYINFNGLADGEYIIYLNSAGGHTYKRLSTTLFVDDIAFFDTRIQLVDMHNTSVGNCELQWVKNAKTLSFQGIDGSYGIPIPWQQTSNYTYYKLYSDDPLNWIIIRVIGDLNTIADHTRLFVTEFGDNVALQQTILKLCAVSWDQELKRCFR